MTLPLEAPEGDFVRKCDRAVGDLSSYFVWLNRGKQSLVAELRRHEARCLLLAANTAFGFVNDVLPWRPTPHCGAPKSKRNADRRAWRVHPSCSTTATAHSARCPLAASIRH